MSGDLQAVLKEVRADLGADFIGSDIVGLDGMSIAGDKANADFNSEIVAAHFAMVMKLGNKVSEEMDMGAAAENQVNTDKAMIFTRALGDGSFFWLLATTRSATLGIVRMLLDEYETQLYKAIPK